MTYGIEEEVFIVQGEKASLESLYYLASLLKKRSYFNYFHTASNFSHSHDLRTGLMGGVEISTEVCHDIDSLMEALMRRRRELANVSSGLIVPVGHLFDEDCPTKTCGMHIHIGSLRDIKKAYRNLAHFLPLLSLLTANSPFMNGEHFGCSYRMHSSPFIGPLRDDPWYRFQDIIISRRLRTLEMRVFDPVWDVFRIRKLLEIVEEIIQIKHDVSFEPSFYISARREAATSGYGKFTKELFNGLREFCDVEEDLFDVTPSDILSDYYRKNGQKATFSALNNGYRNGIFEAVDSPEHQPSIMKIGLGFIGYFIPRLPYTVWKTCREIG
jgi:hypothetical protein